MDISILKKKIIPLLKKFGVKRAGVFGSVARGEATKDSDVDLLVKMDNKADLLDFVRLKSSLEQKLGRKVDLVTYDGLSKFIREPVFKELVKII
jgi:predicted nucleotidyltransferase